MTPKCVHWYDAAFHHYLDCLLGQNRSPEKEIHYVFEIIAWDPLIRVHPDLIASSFMESYIEPKMANIAVPSTNAFGAPSHSLYLSLSLSL